MFELSESIRHYFEKAGWVPGNIPSEMPQSPREKAMALLSEFAGLEVGSVGAGIELAASDVCFYSELKPKASELLKAWNKQTGEVEAIATAHHDHIIVYVGAHGFYAFTDPDSKLYDLGPEFSSAMEKLLLGLNYGTAMASSR
ncbi:SUKH-3 domain-containing protein [Massilia sp. BJB1822]|uniref:SUKH-3 domain-containing protein n=1 Tax=Massilia sp. BJB1822 TaxID=2744470 RepID=UPI001593B079|nr:SUKH-3 domain-containing protein [Massilia sp. BJB1822]NVE00197.1 SUKH-3 domain-containing protein [Massilia sp. BJB1822]